MTPLRKAIAFGLMGLAVAFAIMTLRPGDPGRDVAGTDGAPPFSANAPPYPHTRPASPRPVTAASAEHERPREPATDEGLEAFGLDVEPPTHAEAPRIDRLIAAGFSPVRAEEISRRESELRLAAFYAEYDATGTIRPFNASAPRAAEDQLRADLGDADFERYLRAIGQPTRVVVGNIDTGSPAANAGLLPGDEILTYAGQRVFNQRDLNAAMLGGLPGETVATTVVRDGQAMQLYVLRGPLGFTQPEPR